MTNINPDHFYNTRETSSHLGAAGIKYKASTLARYRTLGWPGKENLPFYSNGKGGRVLYPGKEILNFIKQFTEGMKNTGELHG